MNKKILLFIIVISLSFCSCSKNVHNLSNETTNSNGYISHESTNLGLPENFTIDKIKNALLEYINYRLWLYPAKIQDAVSDKDLDSYINKSINVEIRVYNNSSVKSVYAHTSIGQWLAIFKYSNGFVYCEGQTSEGEYGWPKNIQNYEVIEKYSITIPEPHKPNYGNSQRKDNLIAAVESTVTSACEDFYKGYDKYYDEWKNVDAYIVNFYEYEKGTHVWLCKQDGSITDFPVSFEENNNILTIQPGKGNTIKSKDEFNKFGRFQFEREINDTVKHFKCNIK